MKRLILVFSAAAALAATASARQPTPPAPTPAPAAGAAAQPSDAERGMMRTEALRLLSEADQLATDGNLDQSFERIAKLREKYLGVLSAEEAAEVQKKFDEMRITLGVQILPDGRLLRKTGDEEIDGLLLLMSGSFATDASTATDASPALTYNCARVLIDGLPNAMYFEVSRADDPAAPFRQGILTFVRIGGKLRVRAMDFGNPSLRDAMVGLWAAPEAFPAFAVDNLTVNNELELTRSPDGSGYDGVSTRPFPTYRNGAVEMTSRMRITADGVSFADRGVDANGTPVWGPANDEGAVFKHVAPTISAKRLEDGLVIIDLVPGETGSYALTNGGEVALHFSQWTNDGIRVDSSRNGIRGPASVHFPIRTIAGLDKALANITLGARRRAIIPPKLAYGAQGRPPIPANATLVFDLEIMYLKAPPEPPPVPPVNEGPAGPQPAKPAPQSQP